MTGPRDRDAGEFAGVMRWRYLDRPQRLVPCFEVDERPPRVMLYIELPAPDAPLHEHLAFVGRVAEAVKLPLVVNVGHVEGDRAMVAFGLCTMSMADDVAWAAMKAAIQVKRCSP